MVSTSNNFIFVHIPKTGGNSIQNILKNYSEDIIIKDFNHQDGVERFGLRNNNFNYKKHSTLLDYKKILGKNLFEQMFKFTVVRNPWDRMISYYFSPHSGREQFNIYQFELLIKQIPETPFYTSTNTFIDKLNPFYNHNNKIFNEIDFYLKFENLQNDWKKISKRINIPFESLPHRNKSVRKHYSKYYNNQLKDLVYSKFEKEIKYFNYSF